MKKLLGILGSFLLVSTGPLAVAACGGVTGVNVKNTVDVTGRNFNGSLGNNVADLSKKIIYPLMFNDSMYPDPEKLEEAKAIIGKDKINDYSLYSLNNKAIGSAKEELFELLTSPSDNYIKEFNLIVKKDNTDYSSEKIKASAVESKEREDKNGREFEMFKDNSKYKTLKDWDEFVKNKGDEYKENYKRVMDIVDGKAKDPSEPFSLFGKVEIKDPDITEIKDPTKVPDKDKGLDLSKENYLMYGEENDAANKSLITQRSFSYVPNLSISAELIFEGGIKISLNKIKGLTAVFVLKSIRIDEFVYLQYWDIMNYQFTDAVNLNNEKGSNQYKDLEIEEIKIEKV